MIIHDPSRNWSVLEDSKKIETYEGKTLHRTPLYGVIINNDRSLIPLSSQLIWITVWLQMYNYKNYILLINKGLGYNRFYIKITTTS